MVDDLPNFFGCHSSAAGWLAPRVLESRNSGETRDIAVDRIEELGTDDGVGGRPTDTRNDVQDSNYRKTDMLARPIIRYNSYCLTYRTSQATT